MKRKAIAWTAALLIVAVVAACFLRPAPRDKEVYTISQPVKMELYGKDADRFEVYILGFSAVNSSLGPDFRIAVRSLDGNYYSLGKTVWKNGRDWWSEGGHGVFGYVERMGEDGWEEYLTIGDAGTYLAIFSGSIYNFIWPTEEKAPEEDISVTSFPYWTPGRYRVTMFARDYIPTEEKRYENVAVDRFGSSGDELYEFCFEYDVPERTDAPIDVMLVHLETGENRLTGEPYAVLNASLRANGDIRHIQADTMRFERLDPKTGEYEEVTVEDGDAIMDFMDYWPYWENVKWIRESIEKGRYDDVKYDMEDRLSTLALQRTVLQGWNTEDEYRLTVDFAENVDGSGERYTVAIRLRFTD